MLGMSMGLKNTPLVEQYCNGVGEEEEKKKKGERGRGIEIGARTGSDARSHKVSLVTAHTRAHTHDFQHLPIDRKNTVGVSPQVTPCPSPICVSVPPGSPFYVPAIEYRISLERGLSA